jgi:hypothetical protein
LALVRFQRNVMSQWSALAEGKVSYTDDVTIFPAVRRLKFSEAPEATIRPPEQLFDVIRPYRRPYREKRLLGWGQISRVLRAILRRPLNL